MAFKISNVDSCGGLGDASSALTPLRWPQHTSNCCSGASSYKEELGILSSLLMGQVKGGESKLHGHSYLRSSITIQIFNIIYMERWYVCISYGMGYAIEDTLI